MELQEVYGSSAFPSLPLVATPRPVYMELQEVFGSSSFPSLPPVTTPLPVDMELQEVYGSSAFPSLPPVATPLPAPRASLFPDAITSPPHSTPGTPLPHPIITYAPHSTPVTPPPNPIIDQIRKDNIASDLLNNQLPATIVAMAFTLIYAKSGHYELTGIIMLVLLCLALLAFILGKVLQDERPVVAAVAELVGISLSAAALIYPMSVLLGGPILCFLPPIFGGAVAAMYIYRLATKATPRPI